MGNLPADGGEEKTPEKTIAETEERTELQETAGSEKSGTEESIELQETAGSEKSGTEEKSELQEMIGSEESEAEEGYVGRGFGMGFLAGLLAALICVCVFLLGWSTARRVRLQRERENESQSEETENIGAEVLTDYHTLSKMEEIRNLVEQNYLGDVDSDTLSEYLFLGIAYGLEDEYANYYSPPELETVIENTRGVYFGIGISIEEDAQTQKIRILEVYDGSPAAEAGLAVEDIIVDVDGTSTDGMDLNEVTDLIRSQEDSFSMKVSREGTGELEVELKCDTVERSYVESEMLDGKIGYVRITDFTGSAVKQFREAVETLDEEGMEKMIVDLRGNLGGLFDSVKAILDDILPEGLIVYTETKDKEREEFLSDEKQLVTCEIAVLVDGETASASEIFAGAVQDYGLGPIIGTQTYGKGVVQDTYTLSDGSAIKFTTRKYFTPKGQDIDGNGITPDIVIEEDSESGSAGSDTEGALTRSEDEFLAKALEALTS